MSEETSQHTVSCQAPATGGECEPVLGVEWPEPEQSIYLEIAEEDLDPDVPWCRIRRLAFINELEAKEQNRRRDRRDAFDAAVNQLKATERALADLRTSEQQAPYDSPVPEMVDHAIPDLRSYQEKIAEHRDRRDWSRHWTEVAE